MSAAAPDLGQVALTWNPQLQGWVPATFPLSACAKSLLMLLGAAQARLDDRDIARAEGRDWPPSPRARLPREARTARTIQFVAAPRRT